MENQMIEHHHAGIHFIYLSIAGIFSYFGFLPILFVYHSNYIQELDLALSVVGHVTGLVMFIGYGVLHFEKIRLQIRAWYIKYKYPPK